MEDKGWTVAYRKSRFATTLRRVDLDLTWDAAQALAQQIMEAQPGWQVWYTTNVRAEQTGYVVPKDIGNVLSETGARIRVIEGGELPDGLNVTGIEGL